MVGEDMENVQMRNKKRTNIYKTTIYL